MRYLLKLAFRNLWRQRRRTILTLLAIAVGLVTLIFTDSLLVGFNNLGTTNLRQLETGDIKIHAPGYSAKEDERPLDLTVAYEEVMAAVHPVNGVAAVTPRLVFSGRLHNGIDELPVLAVGIDPVTDPAVFSLPQYTDGRLPHPGTPEAALGRELAEVMDLQLGDFFTLITRTKDEAFQALDFTIVGLISSPHPEVNQHSVYIPLDVATAGLALPGQATEVALRLEGNRNVDRTAEEIARALAGIPAEVFTWKEAAAEFLTISKSEKTFENIMLFFILLIAAVGVINTILLGAMERRSEIGMMKAMGMTESDIVKTFVLEAAGIGVLASVTGCLAGILINLYMGAVGFDFSGFIRDFDIGYPLTGRVYGGWNWSLIGTAFLFGVIISVIASYLPAKRAAQQDPIESLRHAQGVLS
jgi:putative ABC transport system permease protein